ncbi:MAG TPA: CGNR zinc finger domain-containing protein [Acidimicrobiia bacterium]|nr:CGNR zinc finger domain-containing protein [Acidimicrobiia bacterium]
MSGDPPRGLELLRAFVNTHDPDSGDLAASPEGLRAWLAGHGLLEPGEELDWAGHGRALRLREAVRRLGMANHDGVPDPAAAEEVDALARGCGLVVRLGEDGVAALEAAGSGIDAALARLLAILYTATIDGTWPRFKVCRNDTCRWAFYDRSKNRSGRFCGTACGNAVNARAYRRRKGAGSAAAT